MEVIRPKNQTRFGKPQPNFWHTRTKFGVTPKLDKIFKFCKKCWKAEILFYKLLEQLKTVPLLVSQIQIPKVKFEPQKHIHFQPPIVPTPEVLKLSNLHKSLHQSFLNPNRLPFPI